MNEEDKQKYLEEREKELEKELNKQAIKNGIKDYFQGILDKIKIIILAIFLAGITTAIILFLSNYINPLYVIIGAFIIINIIVGIIKSIQKYK